ncbi:hypothetical protein CDAR_386181 [Caerostris darwini]|uniref:Uncharacterized protein n=1 Tax=Caerostris darwini TaxID=1538125 RepID=A0AAV4SID8_9ARAC|nr:hypothetical protein CDAR_386181 [Caerostris darwini]
MQSFIQVFRFTLQQFQNKPVPDRQSLKRKMSGNCSKTRVYIYKLKVERCSKQKDKILFGDKAIPGSHFLVENIIYKIKKRECVENFSSDSPKSLIFPFHVRGGNCLEPYLRKDLIISLGLQSMSRRSQVSFNREPFWNLELQRKSACGRRGLISKLYKAPVILPSPESVCFAEELRLMTLVNLIKEHHALKSPFRA